MKKHGGGSKSYLCLIEPNGIYQRTHVCELLGVQLSTLRREVREGRLRVSRRSGRYFFLGEWLLEWIRTGEVKPAAKKPADPERIAASQKSLDAARKARAEKHNGTH